MYPESFKSYSLLWVTPQCLCLHRKWSGDEATPHPMYQVMVPTLYPSHAHPPPLPHTDTTTPSPPVYLATGPVCTWLARPSLVSSGPGHRPHQSPPEHRSSLCRTVCAMYNVCMCSNYVYNSDTNHTSKISIEQLMDPWLSLLH